MQRFYTMTGTELQSTSIPAPSAVASSGEPETPQQSADKPISSEAVTAEPQSNNGVRSTLKRLMVPELSPPHDHVLESIKSPAPEQSAAINNSNQENEYDELLGMPMDADKSESPTSSAAVTNEEPAQKPKKKHHITNWLLSGAIIFLLVVAVLYYIVQR
jgi:hypothetical protein